MKNKFVWFNRFTVSCVHEYHFHAFQSCSFSYNFVDRVSTSYFRLLSALRVKSKQVLLNSVIITSLVSSMYSPIIIMTWLNFCKVFWRCYYADTKDTLYLPDFVFSLLNYFELLLELIILGVCLKVYLKLAFLTCFLFLLFHQHLIFFYHFLMLKYLNLLYAIHPVLN